MKNFRIITLCLTSYVCNAQLVEHFNDGNFTNDPAWLGSTSHFIINASQQLQLNNTVAATSYLAAPFAAKSIDGYEWEVYVKQSFAGSASNFSRVYLVSSQSNLGGPLNGYYLQLGEAGSNDAVELFRQSGTTHTSVCRAANTMIANAFAVRIKVTRTVEARWTVLIDYSGGTSLVEAASGVDASYTSSSFIGVFCTYTIGNATRFFFDDFIAGPPLGDLVPPVLTSFEPETDTTLRLLFSEALDGGSAAKTQHYVASGDLGHPTMAWLLPDQKTVKLWFSEGFANGKLYQLEMDSVTDLAGNVAARTSFGFRYFVPLPPSLGDIVINELFADPSPTVGLPAQEFVELYNRSEKAFDMSGWKLRDLTTTATLPTHFLLPGEYLIITSSAGLSNYTTHGITMGLPDMPTLNNSFDAFVLKEPGGLSVDSVQYQLSWYRDEDREQGGYTLERLHPHVDSNEPLNWLASEATIGGTPGHLNSVFGRKLDTQPPGIDSLAVLNSKELRVWFDEPMDSLSLTRLRSYREEATAYQPTSVLASPLDVTLSFREDFDNGVMNHLLIDSVFDAAGNSIVKTRVPFIYFVQGRVKQGVILINEIMADPTPVVKLPEAEFIEIVNHGSEPFDLGGWKISDATDTATLSSSIILPGEFIVLTSTTNATKFQEVVRVMGIAGFPSLNNAGEPVVLRGPGGEMIDSLHYSASWFGNDAKRDGGWSLERLRYEMASHWNLNWRPASDSSGGTPGRINSNHGQHPDQVAPSILSLAVVNDQKLLLAFSEPVAPIDIAQIRADSIECVDVVFADAVRVELTFKDRFQNGGEYTLFLPAVSDTVLNKMPPIVQKFRFFEPKPVSIHDLVISEIMADPIPVVGLPEAEYVEVFNRSENPINLSGWQLIDAQGSATLPEIIVLPDSRVTLTSVTSAFRFSPGSNASGVVAFPSLSSEGEWLALLDPQGTMIDSVNYSNSWYRNLEKSEGGWSLELIDPENLCGEEDNWVASESSTGGTPGRLNSAYANKPDLVGPRLLNLELNEGGVVITFNEKLEKSISDVNVRLSPSAGNCTKRFIDARLRRIGLVFEEGFKSSTEYFIEVMNLRDCSGNEIDPEFASAQFAVPEEPAQGDVLISEILFNPFPGGVDFIEVYNRSAKYIDLSGWTLARSEAGTYDEEREIATTILKPNAFLVFTPDPVMLKSHYPQSIDNTLLKTTLPSLPDDAAAVVMLDRYSNTVDSIAYDEDLHADMIRDPEGISLERISFDRSSGDPSNWRSANEGAGFATPGFVNSNSRQLINEDGSTVVVSPEIISHYGANNFALIEYSMAEPGNYVNCRIIDQRGSAIRELAQNVNIGSQGFFRWDGDDDEGRYVTPGYYVVYFEYFDLDGQLRVARKRVIVSPR